MMEFILLRTIVLIYCRGHFKTVLVFLTFYLNFFCVLFYSWMKCGKILIFSLSMLYDLCTISFMKSDGTKNTSILFCNCFFMRQSNAYFPTIANFFTGFFVAYELRKCFKVHGVFICCSLVNWLGNG